MVRRVRRNFLRRECGFTGDWMFCGPLWWAYSGDMLETIPLALPQKDAN